MQLKHKLILGLDQIRNIDKWSNTDVPGLWIYKVGPLSPLGNVIEPEISLRQGKTWIELIRTLNFIICVVADPRSARDCQEGKATCHSQAICSDNNYGFCCQCKRGYYGDGTNCLKEKEAQRVNGQ